MRTQSGCYLESIARTDVKAYDSLSLRIKKFKRSTFNPEVTVIVLRLWNDEQKYFTLHAGINYFHKLTEYGPKEVASRNKELVAMAEQVIATRDYKLIGLLLDRMQELELIPAHPYWYREWVELVNTYCTKPTEYLERCRVGRFGNVLVLPDVAIADNTPFENEWCAMENVGMVDDFEGEIYLVVLDKWIAANRPTDNLQRFIFQNL